MEIPRKTSIYLILLLLNFPTFAKVGEKAFGSFNLIEFNSGDPKFFSSIINNKNVFINFWATYCEPCKKEIPELLSLASKYPQVHF